MGEAKTEAEKRTKVRDMINKIGTAFMVTHGDNGSLHGRPMANARLDETWDTIWFATQKSSGKAFELKDDAHIFLGYGNASGSDYVTVTGTGRIVNDRAKIKELWSPFWKAWFDGPEDPNLVLIAVTPSEAEYWDSGSRVLALLKMAAAGVTGKKLEVGENQKVSM